MMPKNLVYVRHGQSQRNLAGQMAYEKDDLALFEEVINRPSSLARLSDFGVQQAITTGGWLEGYGLRFDRLYTSSFNRAKQTAGLLNPKDAEWFIENDIRERSGGVMENMTPAQRREYLEDIRDQGHLLDPFNFRPGRGDSFADVVTRKRLFFGTLHRECAEGNVLVVNHGDNMWVVEYLLRRWTPRDFILARGKESHNKIPNCMVVHYTRINPETGEESKHLDWVRKCCPWQDPTATPWETIKRKRYSSQELLQQVELPDVSAS